METVADLKTMAPKLNPVVGYWNPLCLGEQSTNSVGVDEVAAVGWLRHAEIKHGRVAMAAFVGFCVQSNTCFPWDLTLEGTKYSDIFAAGGPAAQWDALPTNGKLQILLVIGLLEMWGESSSALAMGGEKHYCRGGKPGYFPSFAPIRDSGLGQPPLDLWDPFGFTKKMTDEQKARKLNIEINNGRLASTPRLPATRRPPTPSLKPLAF